MTKRRDIVRELTKAGFVNLGGANHDKYVNGDRTTEVPRHREIPEPLAKDILRQAGLK
ncbi:MAG: type II toxin-antitoxin system HicA family toxin [Coriobacteriales bacterium]|nr:type II toxin-antitoxin system HicA family toxin [Coriobacteriales bacterium]